MTRYSLSACCIAWCVVGAALPAAALELAPYGPTPYPVAEEIASRPNSRQPAALQPPSLQSEEQESAEQRNDGANGALRVFFDCDRGCDFTFIRQDVDFVNWVRDRNDAQVHVLITRRGSGSGLEYNLEFLGREAFDGQNLVLLYASSRTDTDDERRRGLARTLRLGLAPYIAQTATAAQVDLVSREAHDAEALAAGPEDDP